MSDQGSPTEGHLPTFSPSATGARDDVLAIREATVWGKGEDLDRDGKIKEHTRHQTFRNNVNRATLLLLWLIVLCAIVGIGVFMWHLVLPANMHWMTERQLDQVKTLLSAVILSSALTGYARQRMEK